MENKNFKKLNSNKNFKKFFTNFLGWRNTFRDLKELNWKLLLFLSVATVWYMTWTFVLSPKKIDIWEIMSLSTVVCGAFAGILTSFKKISSYMWSMLCIVFYGVYAWHMGYIGDSLMSFFFWVPILLVGSFFWNINMNNQINKVKAKKWKWSYLFIGLISFIIFTISWLYAIPLISETFTKSHTYKFGRWSWEHILDGLTNSLIMIGQTFLSLRLGVGEILFCIQIPLNIVMWSIMFNLSIIVMLSIYWISHLLGIFEWYNLDKHLLQYYKKLKQTKINKLNNQKYS